MLSDLEGINRKQILVFALGEPRYALYLSTQGLNREGEAMAAMLVNVVKKAKGRPG
jgi:hypothetical protein